MVEAPKVLLQLVETFAANEEDYRKSTFKEAQLRAQFLDPFFEELGWDVKNRQGHSEQYKEVIVEDALADEGRSKAPDYSFRIGRERKFFVEAKKPSVDIEKDPSPAFQLRRYAWSAKLPLSIVSNFANLSVYDTRIKPTKGEAPRKARIIHFHFSEYRDRWQEIASLFSREAILKGAFDRFASGKAHRGTATVDNEFLATIEGWRVRLAKSLFRKHPLLSADELSFIVQSTIDRILFLRICEDRGIEKYGALKSCADGDAYKKLLDAFADAQKRYNSGLFHIFPEGKNDATFDALSASVEIPATVVREIINDLYFPCPYEFAVIPFEILGSVYERFLGSALVLKGRSVEVELKPDLKKAGGVYYTPAHIAKYMVGSSVEGLLNSSADERPRARVLDMACGSGSFLVHTYDELLHWYLDWHKRRGTKSNRALTRVTLSNGVSELRLTLAERRKILLDHIFGVDIDTQAVEVTKLSLFLKLVEDAEVLPRQLELGPFQGRILPDMSNNIKCGNSIVSHDVFETVDLSAAEIEQLKPFDWHHDDTFGPVLDSGGFDVVLGNPPYSYRKATIDKFKQYYGQRYQSTQGNYDVYKMFLERAIELARSGGNVCQIVNSSFLIQPQFENLREVILSNLQLRELAVLGPNVFEGVTIDTAIVLGTKKKRGARAGLLWVCEPENPLEVASAVKTQVSQSRFSRNDGKVFDWRLNDAQAALIDRVVAANKPLEAFFDLSVGINTGSMKDEMVSDRRLTKKYHPCVRGDGIARYGACTTTGFILYDSEVVRAAGARGRSLPPEKFFNSDKILVVRTRNSSLRKRIVATVDGNSYYNLNRLSNIIAKDGADVYTLLGILNSNFVNYLFLTRFFNYEIKPVFLKKVPVPCASDAVLSKLVRARLALETELLAIGTPSKRTAKVTEIALKESAIDARVNDLFGLSPAEVRSLSELSVDARSGHASSGEDNLEDAEEIEE